MRFDLITAPLKEAWKFLKTGFRGLFLNILKIEVFSTLIFIITMLATAVAFYIMLNMGLFSGLALNNLAGTAIGIIIGIILIIIIFLVGGILTFAASAVRYNAVEAAISGKELGFLENFKQNIGPVTKYALIYSIINAIFIGPIIILFLLLLLSLFSATTEYSQLKSVGRIFGEVFQVVIMLVAAVIDLFFQFAIFDIIIAKNKTIGSFKQSFRIVRKNLFETILFSIVLWLIETAVWAPFSIILLILIFFGVAALIPGLLLGPLGMIILIPVVLIIFALAFVFNSLAKTAVIPAQYLYWKRIGEERTDTVIKPTTRIIVGKRITKKTSAR